MPDQRPLHRIAKLLARSGVASRREVERMIEEGRVAVRGEVIDTPATLLASLDEVTVDGDPVAAAEEARLFLFHKPTGVLTTERDPAGRATIYDRLPRDLPRLMPVGRLDLNTEGLLLLTTDGEFKRELELPATGVERAYRARAYGQVTQAQLEELIEGVEIEGVRYGPIDANLERRTGANVWIEMILREGKNREVRRVLEYLGLKVARLIRTRYGPFVLGDLPVGGVGEVRAADLVNFRQTLKAGARRGPVNPVEVTPRASTPRAAPAPRPATAVAPRVGAAPRPAPVKRPASSFAPRDGAPPRGFRDRDAGSAPRAASSQRTPFGARDAARRPDRAAPSSRGSRGRDTEADARPASSERPSFGRRDREPLRNAAPPRATGGRPAPARNDDATSEIARPAAFKRQPGWAKPKPKANVKPRSGPSRPRKK
jgi:23S rRNA pseudouridine2605 synthase